MKQGATALIQSLRLKANANKRRLFLLVLALLLTPPAARAAGVGDILTLIKTIASTIQGAIGGALGGIQTLENTVNNFRQQIIWPLDQLNQAKAFVTSTRAHYGGLMFQIHAIKNNSATLTNSSRLESLFRNGQSGTIGQFQPLYTSVYGNVPAATDARLLQRNMIDMDDSLAQGSLKTTVLSDQTTQGMLALADSIEQQSATAAPGSAPMLATQAGISELESQAYVERGEAVRQSADKELRRQKLFASNQAYGACRADEERGKYEMKAILALIRIWAQNKTENRAAWLQALNRVVCAGERSTGSILFLAFPQELILKLAERTGGMAVRVHVPRLYEGFVRVDEQGRTFLVDPLKNGGQKHTFLFKYADGKILLDDEQPEQAQVQTSQSVAEESRTTQVAVPDEAVEFPSITLDDDGPEVPWVM